MSTRTPQGNLKRREAARLVELLDKVQWPLPEKVFFAILKKTISISVELAVLRRTAAGVGLLLIQRPQADPYYSNSWHMPGRIVKPGKRMIEEVSSLLGTEVSMELEEVCVWRILRQYEYENPNGSRGPVVQYLHSLQLTEEEANSVKKGRFFELNDLPKEMPTSHVALTSWLKQHLPALE